MKTRTSFKTLLGITLTSALLAAPLASHAQGKGDGEGCERGHGKRGEHRAHMMKQSHDKPYSQTEIQVLSQAMALHRHGPGVQVSVAPTDQGTFRVNIQDANGALLREVELNQYAQPVRPGRDKVSDTANDVE